MECLSGKVLFRKTEKLLYEAIAHLTCVFHAHIFSSSQVPVHSDFGRELLKLEACVTLSGLSAKHKKRQYACIIRRYC